MASRPLQTEWAAWEVGTPRVELWQRLLGQHVAVLLIASCLLHMHGVRQGAWRHCQAGTLAIGVGLLTVRVGCVVHLQCGNS